MGGEEKEKQVTVSVTLEIVLTQEDIDDIMCGALEGGITYWCDEAKVVGDYLGEYGSEQIARGGKLRLHLPEPFDKDETEYYELDLEKFKKGVELWAITPVGCNCLEQMDGKIRFDTCNADAIVCDAKTRIAKENVLYELSERNREFMAWYMAKGDRGEEYFVGGPRAEYAKVVVDHNKDFKEIETEELRKVFFTTKEECQAFCNYINGTEVLGYDYNVEGQPVVQREETE